MSKDPKVTTETIAPAEVYKRLGPISRTATAARHELGELPITYVVSRNVETLALVPAWLGKWAQRHAAEVFASLAAEEVSGDDHAPPPE